MSQMIALIAFVLALGVNTQASTFVGNGGNAGDVPLAVTLHQIQEVLQGIKTGRLKAPHCECRPTYRDRPVCRSLEKLNSKQRRFCSLVLKEKSSQLLQWLEGSDDRQVQFHWTHQPITVKEGKRSRAADGVTDRNAQTVILNQDRFLAMNPSERVFLVGHELFHLVKWEGTPLKDQQRVGPFQSQSGGKELLNSMGASLVMLSEKENLFQKYSDSLERSQSANHHWVSLDFGSTKLKESPDSIYSQDEWALSGFRYRYQTRGAWGIMAGSDVLGQEKTILSSIKAKENQQITFVGVSYRYFPFSDPLTYWGQSHLIMHLQGEYLVADYNLNDSYVGTDDKASSVGASLGGKYFIPISYSFWAYVGFSLGYHEYEYKELGVEFESLRSSQRIGVSYGF